MYKGFNVQYEPVQNAIFQKYVEEGIKLFEENKEKIRKGIHDFIHDRAISGSKMQEEWFPKIEADVFISHSHTDKEQAFALAGLLKENGITSFIDSCIWGNSDDLLREIDQSYSWSNDNKTHFDYRKVKYSTSHVHMMLSNALTMMIDKTECYFLLNTPNSIVGGYKNLNQTESPWIYNEIVISKLIKKKRPLRFLENKAIVETFSGGGRLGGELKINYNLDLSHLKLINITNDTFNALRLESGEEPLDAIYKI
jgi:hypothetical protein